MHKLPPTSIYRLRSLAAGPRFYRANAFTRRLEVLIGPTEWSKRKVGAR